MPVNYNNNDTVGKLRPPSFVVAPQLSYVPPFTFVGVISKKLIIKKDPTAANNDPVLRVENSAGTSLLEMRSVEVADMVGLYLGRNAGIKSAPTGISYNLGDNVAVGTDAMKENVNGFASVALGVRALMVSANGGCNTAIGWQALSASLSGSWNTAVGQEALANHTSGEDNTAIGQAAMASRTAGNGNVAIGCNAMQAATATGSSNVVIGGYAGRGLVGNSNVFIGYNAGTSWGAVSSRLAIGGGAVTAVLIYGEFDTKVLKFNATIFLPLLAAAGAGIATVAATGQIGKSLFLNLPVQATPATVPASTVSLYPKADGYYQKTPAGVEEKVAAGPVLVQVNNANYTVAAGVSHIVYTASGATNVLTLPAATVANRLLRIKNDGAADVGLSTTVSQGATTFNKVRAGTWKEIMSDGTKWVIVGYGVSEPVVA